MQPHSQCQVMIKQFILQHKEQGTKARAKTGMLSEQLPHQQRFAMVKMGMSWIKVLAPDFGLRQKKGPGSWPGGDGEDVVLSRWTYTISQNTDIRQGYFNHDQARWKQDHSVIMSEHRKERKGICVKHDHIQTSPSFG